jgi:hypothetical protein
VLFLPDLPSVVFFVFSVFILKCLFYQYQCFPGNKSFFSKIEQIYVNDYGVLIGLYHAYMANEGMMHKIGRERRMPFQSLNQAWNAAAEFELERSAHCGTQDAIAQESSVAAIGDCASTNTQE